MNHPEFCTLPTGRRVAYQRYGDPHGIPSFYFHGWPSSRLQGLLMDEPGRELGLQVVSIDRPGIGHSDRHPGRKLTDWPELLEAVADHLGWEEFHVFGVSGGGPYVLATCHAMPERILSASIICSAPPLKLLGMQDLFLPYRTVAQLKKTFPILLAPAFQVGLGFSYLLPNRFPMNLMLRLLTPEDRRALLRLETLEAVVESFREAVRSGVRNLETDGDIYLNDWGFHPREIKPHVHVWHGQKDRNIPYTYSKKLAALLPSATPHWTPEDGHYSLPVMRVREIIAAALEPAYCVMQNQK